MPNSSQLMEDLQTVYLRIDSILLFVFLLKGGREYLKKTFLVLVKIFCSCLKANRCLMAY